MCQLLKISRKEAKAFGLKKYFTGLACGRGHVSERCTRNGDCVDCARDYAVSYWARNSEKHLAQGRAWRKANQEKAREIRRRSVNAWNKKNPSACLANWSKRNASKLKATPSWACKKTILSIWELYI